MKVFTFALLFFALAVSAFGDVKQSFAGRVILDAPVDVVLAPTVVLSPWKPLTATGMRESKKGVREVAFSKNGETLATGTLTARSEDDDVAVSWTFLPSSDLKLAMCGLMADLKFGDYGGGMVEVDGDKRSLPIRGEARDIRADQVSRLELTDRFGGKRLSLTFDVPVSLFIQYWGGSAMSFRLLMPPDDVVQKLYRAGVVRTLTCRIDGAGTLVKTELKPTVLSASEEWTPLTAASSIRAGSALDFSELVPTDKPAGCHGCVVVRGSHFEFEDLPGVTQRFYGVNLCQLANFPESLDAARSLVRNLRRIGYNAVRIHHHDGYCVDTADPTATRLDETMMARMDSLVTACTEEGIYITTDLFVSRTRVPISWKSCGVDRPGNITMREFKFTAPVHEGVYSNFLAYATNWLNHRNVHTGRRYAEEPAIAWLSLINEGNIDDVSAFVCESHPGWKEAWTTWLARRKAEAPSVYGSIPESFPNGLARNRHGRAFLEFIQDVETRFAERTKAELRRLGCRALIGNMNNMGQLHAALQLPRHESYDYVDTHFYVDHPRFLEKEWTRPSWCPNANPFRSDSAGASPIAALRLMDRPFTITEYNFAGPGRFRGVGGIATGAEAALQDWSGLWRFAWAHGLERAMNPGTHPAGYFDVASDPLQLAAERASLCLFLRRDLVPLTRTYAIDFPADQVRSPDRSIGTSLKVDWTWASWCAKIGSSWGTVPAGVETAGAFDVACQKDSAAVAQDLFGQREQLQEVGCDAVKIDCARGAFVLKTSRTAGGFAEDGAIEAGALKATVTGSAATIWVSSLDGREIGSSSRLLVTHLTEVQNTGARFADAERTILKDFGRLPYLVQRGCAKVSLAVGVGNWRVYALATDGTRRERVPSESCDGRLSFVCDTARDPSEATILYELVKDE